MTHPEQVGSVESQQVGGPVDEHLLRAYREQAEATAHEPLSPAATRPASGRVKVLSVRLNPEEFDELTRYADVRDVPVSGLVRGWVLDHLRAQPDSPAAAVERIAAELEQLRRHLVT